ncbi:hypothetical protein ACLOAV_006816 [Pseudogymnoascus australis]
MGRYTYPYTTSTSGHGHSSQTIWNKFRTMSPFNVDRGDTDSVINLIPTEKVVTVKTPRVLRTGGNPNMCFGSCCRG